MFNTSTSLYTLILWKSACQRFLHISDLSKKIKERNVDPIPTNTQLKNYPSQHFSTQNSLIGSIHIITTVFMWYSQVWLWKTNWGSRFWFSRFFLDCHIMFIYKDSVFFCLWISLWQAPFIEKKYINLICIHVTIYWWITSNLKKTFLINV